MEGVVSANQPVDLASLQVRSASRAVVVLGQGLEEDSVAKEGPKAVAAWAEAALHLEETNRPLARRPNHHHSVVWVVAGDWEVEWEELHLEVLANQVVVGLENRLVGSGITAAAAGDWEEPWVEACKKDSNRATLEILDNLHLGAARALVPSLPSEEAVEALVEQTMV
jgi:hypothetical protein